jgi:hypothetical protein
MAQWQKCMGMLRHGGGSIPRSRTTPVKVFNEKPGARGPMSKKRS